MHIIKKILHKSIPILSLLHFSSLAALDEKKADTKETLAKSIVRIGNGTEPKSIDPAIIAGIPEAHIVDNLSEGLVSFDPVTLEIRPGVAESWTISADGLVYTFKLREAKWSDGTPLTANDFVFAWRRVLEPKTASEYSYQLYYVKNGKEYNTGKSKNPADVAVVAKDPHTLQVTLVDPTIFFLYLTSFHTLHPVPEHLFKTLKKEEDWTKPGIMVSNGPFKLSEWKMNSHLTLVKNEQYWDAKNVSLDGIIFYPYENHQIEEESFVAKELDMISEVPLNKGVQYRAAMNKPDSPYRSFPFLATYFYWFNTKKPPFDNVKVRKAFVLTMDRNLIVKNVMKGGQLPATHVVPDSIPGYKYEGKRLNESVSPDNIKEAKKLLAEAGYPEGKGFPKVQLLYNTNDNHKKLALSVQQMWKKNLGIEVELFNQEWKVYLDSQAKGDFGLSRYGWVADYPDVNTFLNLFVTDGGLNFSKWGNPKYDDLINKAGKEHDPLKRMNFFQQAEEIFVDELPAAPLYFYSREVLVNPKLKLKTKKGLIPWTGNASDRILLKDAVLEK